MIEDPLMCWIAIETILTGILWIGIWSRICYSIPVPIK